ncbi:MAG: hypothetical protein EHM72_08630 [Calditrichaeota bacterium]|nr:MAG: hypothetical protein EHM72_08630 [Calditrichota bacterium]
MHDGVGDVNGDGYEDVAVGMNSDLTRYTTVAWGAVWILTGRPDLIDIGRNLDGTKFVKKVTLAASLKVLDY